MLALALGRLAVLVYTYLGYPVLIALLARLSPLRVDVDPGLAAARSASACACTTAPNTCRPS